MLFVRNILPFLISFAFGSILGVYFDNLYIVLIILALVSLFFVFKSSIRGFDTTLIFSICSLLISSGYFYGAFYASNMKLSGDVLSSIDKYGDIRGIVTSNPEQKDGRQVLILDDSSHKIEVALPKFPFYKYGDEIKVYGKLKLPENFTVANNKEVRYEAMLRARGITLLLDGKRSELISENNGNYIISSLYKFKRHIGDIVSNMTAPESGLLFSMVFGGKNNLDKSIIDYFRIAGLLHIVVLSGQNLTIVAYLATRIFSYTYGFRFGHILALVSIFAYALIGGFEAATMRATFMAAILIILLMYGKVANAGRALLVSAAIMVVINPYILFDDPSFQLSVLAFLGIIYIAPIIQNWLIKKNVNIKLADYIAAIFGAQLSVMPFIIYSSQTFTPYSLLANFLVLLIVGVITVYGIATVFVGLISISIFELLSFPLSFALKYIIEVAHYISVLPYSSITLSVNYYLVIIVYAFLVYYLIRRWRKEDMTPLSQFVLRTETVMIRKGRIPWVE